VTGESGKESPLSALGLPDDGHWPYHHLWLAILALQEGDLEAAAEHARHAQPAQFAKAEAFQALAELVAAALEQLQQRPLPPRRQIRDALRRVRRKHIRWFGDLCIHCRVYRRLVLRHAAGPLTWLWACWDMFFTWAFGDR